jgi:hypothetical protein
VCQTSIGSLNQSLSCECILVLLFKYISPFRCAVCVEWCCYLWVWWRYITSNMEFLLSIEISLNNFVCISIISLRYNLKCTFFFSYFYYFIYITNVAVRLFCIWNMLGVCGSGFVTHCMYVLFKFLPKWQSCLSHILYREILGFKSVYAAVFIFIALVMI